MKTFIRLARILQAYNRFTYEHTSYSLTEKIKDKATVQPLIDKIKISEPV